MEAETYSGAVGRQSENLGVSISGREASPRYKGVIFDVDGVLKRGSKPLPKAAEVIKKLRQLGLKITFLSNLSTKSREQYVDTLRKLGIHALPDELVLATSATAEYVAKHSKTKKVYFVGLDGLKAELEKVGLSIVEPEEAEFVVIGSPFDEEGYITEGNKWGFTGAIRAVLLANARLVAVNPDKLFPGADGKPIPGTGTFLGAVVAATGAKPVIVGKPSLEIYKIAINKIGVKPHEAIMVGDQLGIDIIPAKKLGLTTVLVLTGLTKKEDLNKLDNETRRMIDYVLDNVYEVLRII